MNLLGFVSLQLLISRCFVKVHYGKISIKRWELECGDREQLQHVLSGGYQEGKSLLVFWWWEVRLRLSFIRSTRQGWLAVKDAELCRLASAT